MMDTTFYQVYSNQIHERASGQSNGATFSLCAHGGCTAHSREATSLKIARLATIL